MTCTEQEFRRALQQGSGQPLLETPDGVAVCTEGSELRFILTPGPGRHIGLFRLPTLHVRIAGDGPLPDASRRLLEKIDRAMLRGGG